MDEKLYNAYERLFLLDGAKALNVAVEYILNNKLAKTQNEIAKKTGVSGSTLTAYLKGYKNISKTFIIKFNDVFELDFVNPLTYENNSVFKDLLLADLPPIESQTYLTVFDAQRRIIRAQQITIEGLKKTNNGLQKMMVELYNIVVSNEEVVTTGLMMGKLNK